jgi:ankyrin repeat protein
MNSYGLNLPQRIRDMAALNNPQLMAEGWASIDSQEAREFVFWKCAERGSVQCLEVICKASNAWQLSQLVHCTGYRGRTALSAACVQDCPSTVEFLLRQGASRDEVLLARDSRGWMAIHHAAKGGRVECVRHLLKGASVHATGVMVTYTVSSRGCRCTALELGIIRPSAATARELLLLEHHPSRLGRALTVALEVAPPNIIWDLLRAGADVRHAVEGPGVLGRWAGGEAPGVIRDRLRQALAFLARRAVMWEVEEAALQGSRARLGLEVHL